MRVWNRFVTLTTAILILLTPTASFAWNYTGHRVIASIAYRHLDDQTNRKIAEVLKKHPAYADLWVNRRTNGPDEGIAPALDHRVRFPYPHPVQFRLTR
jgi:hypothetical protein